jgi:uncharacterized protein (TIGR01777 family)
VQVGVTGATGFIGRKLVERLLARGDDVVALTRDVDRARPSLPSSVRLVAGDPAVAGPWQAELAAVDAAVNLAGEPVVGRWSEAKKARIRDSRVQGTHNLVDALGRSRARVLVSGSAVGYYGAHGDEELDESAPAGGDFLASVCQAWEAEAQRFASESRRAVVVRTGVVLGDGGALAKMLPPFRAFVGGPVGSGRQWVSWIHREDLVGLLLLALDDARVSGPLDGVAPAPCTMKELAATIGRVLGRPSWMPVPAAVLRAAFGEGASVLLDGQRVLPKKALALGYKFRFETLAAALADLLIERDEDQPAAAR